VSAWASLGKALEEEFHLFSVEAPSSVLNCELKVYLLAITPIWAEGLIGALRSRREEINT
jgi:hypothetical protein